MFTDYCRVCGACANCDDKLKAQIVRARWFNRSRRFEADAAGSQRQTSFRSRTCEKTNSRGCLIIGKTWRRLDMSIDLSKFRSLSKLQTDAWHGIFRSNVLASSRKVLICCDKLLPSALQVCMPAICGKLMWDCKKIHTSKAFLTLIRLLWRDLWSFEFRRCSGIDQTTKKDLNVRKFAR